MLKARILVPKKMAPWKKSKPCASPPASKGNKGARTVDNRLKKLIQELSEAINLSLSESEQISRAIAKLKDEGYDIFLVLEATIGLNHRDEQQAPASPELVGTLKSGPDPGFSISASDVRFLKALRISVEER
jgi:hypothetical protein